MPGCGGAGGDGRWGEVFGAVVGLDDDAVFGFPGELLLVVGTVEVGKDGGFRSNIRDAARQAQSETEGRMIKSEDAATNLVEGAKADYNSNPQDRVNIRKYVEALISRGTPA